MPSRSEELEHRLVEMRGRRLRPELRRWLANEAHVTTRDEDFLAVEETLRLRNQFIARLRSAAEQRECWPSGEATALEARLTTLAERLDGLRAIWLHNEDRFTGAVNVPAAPILRVALDVFVTKASDLMLSTTQAADGLAVELNHMQGGDEYEWSAWGLFAQAPG